MFEPAMRYLWGLGVAAWLLSGQVLYAEQVILEWQRAPEDSYFQGVIETNGETVRFQTRGHWLIIPRESRLVELRAYDRHRRLRAPQVAVNQHTPVTSATLLSGTPPDDKTTYLPPEGDLSPQKDMGLAHDPFVEGEASAERDRTAGTALTWPPPSYLGVQLIYGSERIESRAGTSSLSGGNTTYGVRIERAWLESVYGEGWSYQWHLSTHQLKVPLLLAEDEGAGAQDSQVHWRGELGFATGYELAALVGLGNLHQLTGLFGVNVWRTPVLVITNDSVGTSALKDVFLGGPFLGLNYQRLVMDRTAILATLFAAPYAVGKHPGASRRLFSLRLRRAVTSSTTLNLGYQFAVESALPKGVCRVEIPSCQEVGTTNLSQSLFVLGLDRML